MDDPFGVQNISKKLCLHHERGCPVASLLVRWWSFWNFQEKNALPAFAACCELTLLFQEIMVTKNRASFYKIETKLFPKTILGKLAIVKKNPEQPYILWCIHTPGIDEGMLCTRTDRLHDGDIKDSFWRGEPSLIPNGEVVLFRSSEHQSQ